MRRGAGGARLPLMNALPSLEVVPHARVGLVRLGDRVVYAAEALATVDGCLHSAAEISAMGVAPFTDG